MATITINGNTFTGNNISMKNNIITIDGVGIEDKFSGIVEIRILEGTVENLISDASVSCLDVSGNVRAGGSVSCGDVSGDVKAGGSISCGNVHGDVDAGGSVSMRK